MIETPTRIEPCFFEDAVPRVLADLVTEIQRDAGELERGLHPSARSPGRRSIPRDARWPRNVVSKMVKDGFLAPATPKGPVRIAFPLDHRERLFPSLFADAGIDAPEPPKIGGAR